MKVHELIEKLKLVDPDNEIETAQTVAEQGFGPESELAPLTSPTKRGVIQQVSEINILNSQQTIVVIGYEVHSDPGEAWATTPDGGATD